jgi:hypothetical protein
MLYSRRTHVRGHQEDRVSIRYCDTFGARRPPSSQALPSDQVFHISDPPRVTAAGRRCRLDGGGTVARSHGTRGPTPRANRMSRVRVARSRVRPMVRLYIAHVGVEVPLPTWSDFSRAGLHRGWIACHLGRNLRVRRLTHGPCVCSIQDKTKVDVITFPDVNSEHIPHASDTGHVLAGRPPVVPCGQSLVASRLRRG